MRRRRALALAPIVCLVLAALGASLAAASLGMGEPTYSPSALRAGLARAPDHWLGRTVRLHGVVLGTRTIGPAGCLACSALLLQSEVYDPGADFASPMLPLVPGPVDDRLAALRALPGLGGLLPRPQVIINGLAATYRVRLGETPSPFCARRPCYQAVLLDAAFPDSGSFGGQPPGGSNARSTP